MAATGSELGTLESVLGALAEAKLEAVVVGATAAVLQGAPLMTADVDLLVRDTPRNREKFQAFAVALGASRPRLVSDLSTALTIEGGPVPLDLLLESLPGGLSFASVRSRAVKIPVGAQVATVASLEDVMRSKIAAGRPKDVYHVEILRQVLQVRRALEGSKSEPK